MTYSDGITKKLNIKDICGKNTVSRSDGKVIHESLLDHWEKAGTIEIDFGNLVIASVSFLDEAIGQLALRFNRKELVSKLKLTRISSLDKRLLNDIFISRYRQKMKGKRKPNKSLRRMPPTPRRR